MLCYHSIMVYSQAYAIRKHLGMLPAFLHNKIYFGNGRKRVLTTGEERSKIGDVRGKIAALRPWKTQDIGVEKNFRKSEKKVLTKRRSCGILQKLSRKTTGKHLENYIVHQQQAKSIHGRKTGFERTRKTRPSEKSEQQCWETLRDWTQEFDPGSGRTLAACLTHASRTGYDSSELYLVANGWVTREQPASLRGITTGNGC